MGSRLRSKKRTRGAGRPSVLPRNSRRSVLLSIARDRRIKLRGPPSMHIRTRLCCVRGVAPTHTGIAARRIRSLGILAAQAVAVGPEHGATVALFSQARPNAGRGHAGMLGGTSISIVGPKIHRKLTGLPAKSHASI